MLLQFEEKKRKALFAGHSTSLAPNKMYQDSAKARRSPIHGPLPQAFQPACGPHPSLCSPEFPQISSTGNYPMIKFGPQKKDERRGQGKK